MTRAARRLQLAQPALSQAIARLEKQLGPGPERAAARGLNEPDPADEAGDLFARFMAEHPELTGTGPVVYQHDPAAGDRRAREDRGPAVDPR